MRIGSKQCFTKNYITGGVFNINLAPAKKGVKSPEVDPKRKKWRLIYLLKLAVAKNPEFFSSSLEL